MTRTLTASLLLVALAAGCQPRTVPPAAPAPGPASAPGWEVRYNATLALARRGSAKVQDEAVWDTLLEMLDEEQLFRNFRVRTKGGREVADEASARMTLVGTLQAVAELHRKNPKLDLAGLKPAVEKLTQNPSALVRKEAKQTQQLLWAS